jgi:hypothetical protein
MAIIDNTKAPPLKNTTNRASSKPNATPKKSILEERTEALTGLGQLAQVPLIATKQYADAGAVGIHWPGVSKELAELAETQEEIAKFIDPLIKIGPYTGLVTAVLPLILQLAVNHGVTPAGAMGTVPANMLSAQVEASLAEQEMIALQAQLDAEKAAEEIRNKIKEQRRDMANSQASQATVVVNDANAA